MCWYQERLVEKGCSLHTAIMTLKLDAVVPEIEIIGRPGTEQMHMRPPDIHTHMHTDAPHTRRLEKSPKADQAHSSSLLLSHK